MSGHPSKSRWEKENTVQVVIKINRNQDPELYELISKADSKSGTTRDLLRAGLTPCSRRNKKSPAGFTRSHRAQS